MKIYLIQLIKKEEQPEKVKKKHDLSQVYLPLDITEILLVNKNFLKPFLILIFIWFILITVSMIKRFYII